MVRLRFTREGPSTPGVHFGLFRVPPIKSSGEFGSSILNIPHTSLLQTLAMAQSTTLEQFNPFTTHPFTNNNVVDRHPAPAPPSKYPRPIPSSATQYTTGTPAHMQSPKQSSYTNNIIHSPEPRRPIPLANAQQPVNATRQGYPKPIFTRFQQDRSSPELEEILLRRKLTQALGHVALGLDVKQDAYSSS